MIQKADPKKENKAFSSLNEVKSIYFQNMNLDFLERDFEFPSDAFLKIINRNDNENMPSTGNSECS